MQPSQKHTHLLLAYVHNRPNKIDIKNKKNIN